LNFNIVGYGCTTCIGNSGRCRLISKEIEEKIWCRLGALGHRILKAGSIPKVRAKLSESPPLVVGSPWLGGSTLT